jgi:muramoyltetrapeptide carboxypeptidase
MRKLNKGDTIGIPCPSHIANAERYGRVVKVLESLGYRVQIGENAYKDTHGYLASEQERADDFNRMVSDGNIKMIFFGGGKGANEILPYLDYESIKRNPKFYCSYSDGTFILNAIHAMTGITVYYGQAPGDYTDLRHYDYTQFSAHFTGEKPVLFEKNSEWHTLNGGKVEGFLLGGYLSIFALMLGNRYFKYDKDKKYILFLEAREETYSPAAVSSFLSHIEQNNFISNIAGIIFGHYSKSVPADLFKRFGRFGQKYDIPVIYCDDFGHGVNHAILPIGEKTMLDADKQVLRFL